jgi:RHS repeat-associated protein
MMETYSYHIITIIPDRTNPLLSMKPFIEIFIFAFSLISFQSGFSQCNSPTAGDVSNTCVNPNVTVLTIRATNTISCGQTISHRWYTTATGSEFISGTYESVGTCAVYQTKVDVNVTSTYWVSAITNGCESERKKVSASFYKNDTPIFTLSPASAVSTDGLQYSGAVLPTVNGEASITLSARGGSSKPIVDGGSIFEWYDSPTSTTPLSTGSDFTTTLNISSTVNAIKIFYVGGTLKNNLGCSFPIGTRKTVSVQLQDYQSWINSVVRNSPQVEFANNTSVLSADAMKVQKQFDYFDGLGRISQSVHKQGSPHFKDVVQPIVYDVYGRKSRHMLPFVAALENTGNYKPNVISSLGEYVGSAYNFYNNPLDDIADDSKPYSETFFDGPLHRIKKIGAPGADWQPSPFQTSYANISQTFSYADFVTSNVGGGGTVSVQIQNSILTVTFSAGFSAVSLKTGELKTIYSNPLLPEMDLGLISMGNYRASIKNGSLYIEAVVTPAQLVTGFGITTPNAARVFSINLIPPDHSIKYSYGLNGANEVLKWTYDNSTNSIDAGSASSPIYFGANKLMKIKKLDEHDKATIEYINSDGQTLLKRVQVGNPSPIDDTNYASTYYVYDERGNLVVILPPEAVKRLSTEYFHGGSTPQSKKSFLNVWAFQNTFDERKRISTKRAPGAKPIYFIYDSRNRVVLTQDGNQRRQVGESVSKEWSFTKYDFFNRPIMTGVYTHNGNDTSRQEMQNYVHSQMTSGNLLYEDYTGVSSTDGYTNRTFPTENKDVFTVTFYDNYDFLVPVVYLGNPTLTDYNYRATDLVPQPPAKMNPVNGLVTAIKIKELGTSNYSWTVNYYDSKYRLIQTLIKNNRGGIDRNTTSYDFAGKVLQSKRTYNVNGNTTSIAEKFVYDHAGRLLVTTHSINGDKEVAISGNYYNELGQLISKGLHDENYPTVDTEIGAPNSVHAGNITRNTYSSSEKILIANNSIQLQSGYYVGGGNTLHARIGSTQEEAAAAALLQFKQVVDYRYNILGWMTQINDVTTPGADYFCMNLRYNDPTANGGSAQYNGNISESIWQTIGDPKQSYGYSYDNMNRLLKGQYYDLTTIANNGRYNEEIGVGAGRPAYDMNGNIMNLKRVGRLANATYGTIDDLQYDYANGNQLTKVDDASGVDGFKDVAGSVDYQYDFNGSMKSDANKALTKISYNHLNLPDTVKKSSTEYIVYTYDATGRKLKQQVFGTEAKTTDYIGELIYENSILQFINHAEGRAIPNGSWWEYQYHLKDHLGNVRVTFATTTESESATGTLESSNLATEQSQFLRYQTAKRVNSSLFDRTNGAATGFSERLNGSANEKYGLAKSISVMPGDVINMEVYAKYVDTNSSNWTTALTNLMTAISNNTGGIVIDGTSYSSSTSSFAYPGYVNTSGSSGAGPKAYLNWIVFDKDFNMKNAGFVGMTTAAKETGQDVAHEKLSGSVQITQPGYVYVFLSNEEMTPVEVYFDDFKVEHVKSPIVQMDDYYPFGLAFNSYQRENSVDQKFKFQGQEHIEDLGLNWDSFKWRNHQPDIGRFFGIDPLSEKFYYNSPYAFSENKVVAHVELEGLESYSIKFLTNGESSKYENVTKPLLNEPAQEPAGPPSASEKILNGTGNVIFGGVGAVAAGVYVIGTEGVGAALGGGTALGLSLGEMAIGFAQIAEGIADASGNGASNSEALHNSSSIPGLVAHSMGAENAGIIDAVGQFVPGMLSGGNLTTLKEGWSVIGASENAGEAVMNVLNVADAAFDTKAVIDAAVQQKKKDETQTQTQTPKR